MSRHKAIAQDRMRSARMVAAFALREMRQGCAAFYDMHRQDYERARDRFGAYWLASDCAPPNSLRANY